MAYQSHTYRDGNPPRPQATGHYRGTIDAVGTDSSIYTFTISAPDLAAWNAAIPEIPSRVNEYFLARDALQAVSDGQDPAANGDAGDAEVCVAYIRTALNEEVAYEGYKLLNRVNNWVGNNGGWGTVTPTLLAAGLTQAEHDTASAAWTYFNTPERIAAMTDYEVIQGTWRENRRVR